MSWTTREHGAQGRRERVPPTPTLGRRRSAGCVHHRSRSSQVGFIAENPWPAVLRSISCVRTPSLRVPTTGASSACQWSHSASADRCGYRRSLQPASAACAGSANSLRPSLLRRGAIQTSPVVRSAAAAIAGSGISVELARRPTGRTSTSACRSPSLCRLHNPFTRCPTALATSDLVHVGVALRMLQTPTEVDREASVAFVNLVTTRPRRVI